MVNVEKFAERLNSVMEFYELSAGNFADRIEVQRSSISHILSGRNKPSLDFVLKVLKEFPDVELYWLLNGVGSFPKKALEKAPPITNNSNTPTPDLFSKEVEYPLTENEIIIPVVKNPSNKEIERIVIFYKDGTFTHYNP